MTQTSRPPIQNPQVHPAPFDPDKPLGMALLYLVTLVFAVILGLCWVIRKMIHPFRS